MKSLRPGFLIRLLAFLIDQVIIFFFIALFVIPIELFFRGLLYSQTVFEYFGFQYTSSFTILGIAYTFFIFLIYAIVVPNIIGGTPGKVILKLRIVMDNGSKPPLKVLLYRELIAKTISLIPFGFGFFAIAFDLEKKGWHDKMSKTCVIFS